MSDRESNRSRFPDFSALVDRYRSDVTAACVYDPRTGLPIVGTHEAIEAWPAEILDAPVPTVSVERRKYRGRVK